MTVTCTRCDRRFTAGQPPVVDRHNRPVCDRCVSLEAGPDQLARLDRARAHARASAGKAPNDAAQQWLDVWLRVYFVAGFHDPLDPMTVDDTAMFLEFVAESDPEGFAQHSRQLMEQP